MKSELQQRKQLVEKYLVGIGSWLIEESENVVVDNINTTVRGVANNIDDAKNTDNPSFVTNLAIEEVIGNDNESAATVNNPFTKKNSEVDKAISQMKHLNSNIKEKR